MSSGLVVCTESLNPQPLIELLNVGCMHSKHFQYLHEDLEYRVQASEHSVYYMTCDNVTDVIPWWGKEEPFVNNPLAICLLPHTKTSSMKL